MMVRNYASLMLMAACASPTAVGTQSTMSRPEGGPRADAQLATYARTDPAPVPAERLIHLIQPLGQPISPEALAQLAAFIRWYERDPFDPRIGMNLELSVRATLLGWLTESPDVSVTITNVLGELMEHRGEGSDQLNANTTMGSLFGMASHAIEHPEYTPESFERMVAGVSSALRWYTAALARGGARSTILDELVAAEAQGQLAEVFNRRVRELQGS
ncbi:MAG: hypothetical protein AB8H86_32745 [Polyangiales bacterium]